MKENTMIKVHIYNGTREIKTSNYEKVFMVKKKAGKLGIDWNTEKDPLTCNGEVFTPFEAFAENVIFEKVR